MCSQYKLSLPSISQTLIILPTTKFIFEMLGVSSLTSSFLAGCCFFSFYSFWGFFSSSLGWAAAFFASFSAFLFAISSGVIFSTFPSFLSFSHYSFTYFES